MDTFFETPKVRGKTCAGDRLNRLRQSTLYATLCFALVFTSGCLHTRHAADFVGAGVDLGTRARVAVIPLENLTNYPKAGLIAAELLSTEIYRRDLFELVEGTALRQALTSLDIDLADLAADFAAADLANRLEVDAVLIGSVSEYGYQHGLHEEPVVGLNLRLVRAGEGEVLWASSHSTTGRGYIVRDSVNAAAQRLIAEMLATLDADGLAR